MLIGAISFESEGYKDHLVTLAKAVASLGKRSALYSFLEKKEQRDLAYFSLHQKNLFPYLSIDRRRFFLSLPEKLSGNWVHIDCRNIEKETIFSILNGAKEKNIKSSLYFETATLSSLFPFLQMADLIFLPKDKGRWKKSEISSISQKIEEGQSIYFLDDHSIWLVQKNSLTFSDFHDISSKDTQWMNYAIAGLVYGHLRERKEEESLWIARLLSSEFVMNKDQEFTNKDWERIRKRIYLEESMVFVEKEDYLGSGSSRFDQ